MYGHVFPTDEEVKELNFVCDHCENRHLAERCDIRPVVSEGNTYR
jgi:hypothetical protein